MKMRFSIKLLLFFVTVFGFNEAYAVDFHVPTNYTLSNAITNANNNDNIIIDSNINSDLTLSPEFIIDKILNYKSNVPVTPSAISMYLSTLAGSNRHFNFTANASGSAFSDIILKNTFVPTALNAVLQGGAIITTGANLSFTNTTFDGNRSANQGGAVYSDGGILNINNGTVFNSNLAMGSGSQGGAIYTNDNLIIGTANFTSNSVGANGQGGAIYTTGSSLTINGASFTTNKTGTPGQGGAIYAYTTNIIIGNGASFTGNNSLTGSGGAIYISNGDLEIGTATFSGNFASTGFGGAVYLLNTDLVLNGAEFTSNYARRGGAIYSDGGKITVNNGTIFNTNNNVSNLYGGAIYTNADLDIGVASFISNKAGVGGAIYSVGENLVFDIIGTDSLNMVLFQGNSATNTNNGTRKVGAGAIYFDGINSVLDTNNPGTARLTINCASFVSNVATSGMAGAIFVDNAFMTIENSMFDGNKTTGTGMMAGTIYSGPGANTTISNTIFQNGSATNHGGVINNSGVMNLLAGNEFKFNSSTGWGGVIANIGNFNNGEAEFYPQMTITDNYFYQNRSSGGGGAIANGDNSTKFDIFDTKFEENEGLHGGAVYNETVASLTGVEFLNNYSVVGGNGGGAFWSGATWAIGEKIEAILDDVEFTGNFSATNGGAVYLNMSASTSYFQASSWLYPSLNTTTITNSFFTGNTTTGNTSSHGGAVYASITIGDFTLIQDRILTLDIDETEFELNSSNGSGGVFYLLNSYRDTVNNKLSNLSVNITNAEFTSNNSNVSGGVFYNLSSGFGTILNLTVEDSSFTGNSATTSGGIIYNSTTGAGAVSDIILTNNTFTGNTAGISGGVFYLNGRNAVDTVNLTLSGNSFEENKVEKIAITGTSQTLSGGVIYNIQNSNVNFTSNHIFNKNEIVNTLTNAGTGTSSFAIALSSFGGGIYNASNSYINASAFALTFEDNKITTTTNATNSGDSGTTSTANSSGGAIYNNGSNITTNLAVIQLGTGSKFKNNKILSVANSESTSGNGVVTATANSYGGVIYNTGAGAKIDLNGTILFELNTATSLSTSIGAGVLTQNSSVYGGAIYNTTSAEMNLIGIEKTGATETRIVFKSNSATANTQAYGGAVWNNSKMIFENVLFESNSANSGTTGWGGAIYNTSSNLSLNNVEFKGNIASGNGGALYTTSQPIFLGSIIFDGNSSQNGGALYTTIALTLNNIEFKNNISNSGAGGAIYFANGSGTSNIASVFTNNSAVNGNGGAIHVNGGTVNINGGSVFSGNFSNGGLGGAIYNNGVLNLVSTLGNIVFSDNKVDGVGNDIYNVVAKTININGTVNDVVLGGGISGLGTVTKTGDGRLLINGDSSSFKGTFSQTAGYTIVSSSGLFFGGADASVTNTVSGTSTVYSLVQITGSSVYEKLNVGNYGNLIHYSNSLLYSDINTKNLKFTGANASMTYGADQTLIDAGKLAKYNLATHINQASGANINKINFVNSDVTFGTFNYTAGSTTYRFENSTLNLLSGGVISTEVLFNRLDLSNAKLSFDVGFNVAGTALEADRIAVSATSGIFGENFIDLGDINFINGVNDTGKNLTYSATVLRNLVFKTGATSTTQSNAYKYRVSVSGTNVILTAYDAGNENSLYVQNAKFGDRDFNMTFFENNNTYYIGQSLSATSNGIFLVVGKNTTDSIISGKIVDNTGSFTGSKGSFFDLSGATAFTLRNLTIQDAQKTGNGSVISLTNLSSSAVIDNVVFKDNIASEDGGAIYRNVGNITYNNAISFTGNQAGGNGGAIYNVGNSTLNQMTFTNNSASGNGGAIYHNSGTLIINGGTYSNNSAQLGGAIYNNGTLNLNSSSTYNLVFSGNSAVVAGTDIYTTSIVNIAGSAGSVSLNGGIGGSGQINNSAVDLILGGDNSGYTGIFTQSAGKTTLSGAMFNGIQNINAGIYNLNSGGTVSANSIMNLAGTSILNINTNDNIALNSASVLRGTVNTVVNKAGTGILNINADNSSFVGTYNQTAGNTVVSSSGKMFNGVNNITTSNLEITSGSVYEKANIGNGGTLTHYSNSSTVSNISSANLKFINGASNGAMIFDTVLADPAKYKLMDKIDNNQLNNQVWFKNSSVSFGSTNYTGTTTYKFENSEIDMTSDALEDVSFNNVNLVNSKVSFDVSFANIISLNELLSDTLIVSNATGDATVGVGIIKIVNDQDVGLNQLYTTQVLSGLTFNNNIDTVSIATNVYMYDVSVNGTNIEFTAVDASDPHALYIQNAKSNKRGFNISYFTGTPVMYHIDQSLSNTANGELIVQGFDGDATHGVISGKLVDLDGNFIGGDNGSFFNLVGTTIFTLKNITIEDAYKDGNGSVVSITSATSSANISNVILKDTVATGNGGAIYASAGSVALSSFEINDNSAGVNGGAIYNSSNNFTVSNIVFNTNEAIAGNGGAIYNVGTMLFTGTNEFNGNITSGNGGAVYNTGNITFEGVETSFYGNQGIYGSALYVNSGNVRFDSLSQFVNNIASYGAVAINSGTLTFNNEVNFTNNDGGALYINGGIVNMNKATSIIGNESSFGAVYNAGTLNLGGGVDDIITFSNNGDGINNNDITMIDTGVMNIVGAGDYLINGGITGTSLSRINITGAGSYYEAQMDNFLGTFTQNALTSSSLIKGDLNAVLYTITSGVAEFEKGLGIGKIITTGTNGEVIINNNVANFGTINGNGLLSANGEMTNTTDGIINVRIADIKANFINYGLVSATTTNLTSGIQFTNNLTVSGTNLNVFGDFNNTVNGIVSSTNTNINGTFINNGTMNGNNIIVAGTLDNNSSISVNNILITNAGNISSSASDIITANGIINNGQITFEAGTNNNIITGSGNLIIDGTLDNLASITQDNLNVGNGDIFNSAYSNYHITNAVNNGNVNFTGNGTFNSAINGSGVLAFTQGTVNNATAINQKLVVGSGARFNTVGSYLDTIGTDGIDINGALYITSGNANIEQINLFANDIADVPELNLKNGNVNTINLGELNTQTDSKIVMEVYANGNSDFINVSGDAILNGQLHITAGVGAYRNVEFTLLTAGNLTGDLIDDINNNIIPNLAFVDGSFVIDSRFVYDFETNMTSIMLTISGINASNFSVLSGLTFNQSETASAFDTLSKIEIGDFADVVNNMIDFGDEESIKEALSETSPYFLANVLRPQINNANRASLYGRLKNDCPECNTTGFWVEGGFAQNNYMATEDSIGDFTSTQTGGTFGIDRFFVNSSIIAGLFGSFMPEDIQQGNHQATVQSFGGGAYVGFIGEKWDVKTYVSGNMNSYDMNRKIYQKDVLLDRLATSTTSGFSIIADIEGSYKFKLNDTVKLRPYAGFEGQMFTYDGFSESGAGSMNVEVQAGNVMAYAPRLGVSLEGGKNKFGWRIGGEYNFIVSGYDSVIDVAFVNTDFAFQSQGAEIGTGMYGVNGGVEYNITDSFRLYANGEYNMADGFSGMKASMGLRYIICGDKKISNLPIENKQKIAESYYKSDSDELTLDDKMSLVNKWYDVKGEDHMFSIEGNADSTGRAEYNQKLSERRAKKASDYLVELGASPDKVTIKGYGERNPVAPNETEEGKALNRRVDFFVY